MSARPRPVTATVTKPPWMQVPDVDAAMYRRHSLTSNGSTASLTSVLDHESYVSDTEFDLEKGDSNKLMDGEGNARPTFGVHFDKQPKPYRKVKRHTGASMETNGYNMRSSNSCDSGLSAWEVWLVQKAKEERRKHRQDQQLAKQAKQEQQAKEQEKRMKEQKAQEVRKEWLQKKNTQQKLCKKMEKLKIENEKQLKLEQEDRVHKKSEAVFEEWKESKLREEREDRRKEKEKKRKEQEEKQARQEQAQQKYLQWLKRNKRPQSAPAQPQSGYNNNAPYPQPGYVNPIPWQHPHIPKVKQDKPKKSKPRRYVWNPDKYF